VYASALRGRFLGGNPAPARLLCSGVSSLDLGRLSQQAALLFCTMR
jgi:hypothetical protein